MLIFLYGSDSYRRLQKINFIISRYRSKHAGLSLKSFDLAAGAVLSDLKNFLVSQSLFETQKLARLSHPFSSDNIKGLKNILLSALSLTHTTLLIESDLTPPAPLKFLLASPVKTEEFKKLAAAALLNFIKSESAALKISLSSDAISRLAAICGSDTWLLKNELHKLSLLGQKIINLADLAQINLSKNYEFFFLLNNLFSPDLKTRLPALFLLFHQAVDPVKIFNVASASRSANQSKFAASDLDLKSGRLEPDLALLNLILN